MKENNMNLINEEEEEINDIQNQANNIEHINTNTIQQQPSQSSVNNQLLCKVPSKEEIIKVENCSFIKETKKISIFYFCSCSKEEFYPICEACALKCHKIHKPTQTIKGIYICKCGECNHQITEENEKIFNERKKKQAQLCFYSKLLEVSPGIGYFNYKGKIICGVCINNCVALEKDEKDRINEYKINDNSGHLECLCEKHFEQNLVNLNLDFASKPKFNLCFENINFNVLSKIPLTKEKYITYLISHIQEYKANVDKGNNETIESNKFFTDFITGKILECFSLFSSRFENKYFFIEDYLKDFSKKTLIQLLKISKNLNAIDEGIRGDFFRTKFHYAELLFNYIIRKYHIQNNNIWNIRTLINMNLYQRKIFAHQTKNFYEFQGKKDLFDHGLIGDFIESILELYDTALYFCKNVSDDLSSNLFESYFPTFNRIMKYIIKINFLNKSELEKYFDLVYDTVILWFSVQKKDEINLRDEEEVSLREIQEQKEYQKKLEETEDYKLKKLLEWVEASQYTLKKNIKIDKAKQIVDNDIEKEIVFEPHLESNHLKGVYYVMKAILYSLLYENDRICFEYFRDDSHKNDTEFIFEKSPTTDKICKIFMLIIQKFYRKETMSRTIIYDYYIQKILELLIQKQDNFYMTSLNNLTNIEECEVSLISSNNIFEDSSKIIEQSYLDMFNSFCEKLGDENIKYLNYYIKFDEYLTNALLIIKEFEKNIKAELPSMPDITMKYLHFIGISNHPNTAKKMKLFQRTANFSLLYSRLEQFMSIYYQGKKYNKIDTKKSKPLLDFILTFLFLLAYRNQENLSLIMNFKPLIFVETFLDNQKMMFLFLERICEMYHSGEYEFDNFYFYSECLCYIILQIENKFRHDNNLTEDEKIDLLETLGNVFYLTNKSLHNTNIKQYDAINIIDRIQRFTNRVKFDERFKCIQEILESYITDVKPNPKLKTLFKSYFVYLCKLIQGDFAFFTITSPRDLYLIDKKSIFQNINTLIFKKITDVQEEYSMLRYYLTCKLQLKATNNRIQNQAIRLFKNNFLFEDTTNAEFESEGEESDKENLNEEKEKLNIDNHEQEQMDENEDKDKAIEDEDDPILEKYDSKFQLECINASMINLSINKPTLNKKQFAKKIINKIKKYSKIANILYQVTIKFNEKIDEIMEDEKNEFPNPFNKYIFLLKYYEHIILRPAYKLFNLFMIDYQFIIGKNCLIYQALILEVLKLTVKLYLNLDKLSQNSRNEEIDREKKYYNQCFEKGVILRFENVSIRRSLLAKDIEEIIDDIKYVSNKIKYYYIVDIYRILIKDIGIVLYAKPKLMETIKSKSTLSKQSNIAQPEYIIKMYDIIKDYQTSFEKTFDNKLTLFNALEEIEKEIDIEVAKELLMYLLTKLGDDLTDENCYYYDYDKLEYRESYLSKINIRHFKLQNSNIILFLNGLFYNYSERFQSCLKESIGKYFDNIFLFLVINIIFACNVKENMKLYDLAEIVEYNVNGEKNRSLCLDLCTASLKLIQNMCEGHNQIFQQRFFNYKINIDDMKYINKKVEKEMIFNAQKKEDDEYYLIYNITKKKKKTKRPKIIQSKRALMLNSQWFKNIYTYLNAPERQKIFDSPELKIIDILRLYLEKLELRKKEGKPIDEPSEQELLERERRRKEEEAKKKAKFQMHEILEEFLKKPINSSVSRRSSFNKSNAIEIDNKEEEARDLQYLREKKYSFLNFLFNNMRLIIDNIHISDKLKSQIFKQTQTLKSTEDIIDIYQHITDLVVEMIQGTGVDNFNNFYRKLTRNYQVLDEQNNLNTESLESFLFIHHCMEVAKILWQENNLFNTNLNMVCLNLFQIINNIIGQQLNDISLIKILVKIFPPDKLLNVICEYLKGLALHHLKESNYDSEEFEEELFGFELDSITFDKLVSKFKSTQDIHEDPIFSLAAQMYLFIIILGKNYKIEEAVKIFEYENKELYKEKKNIEHAKSLRQVQSIKEVPGGLSLCQSFLGEITIKKKKQKYKKKTGSVMSKLNNYIITAKFFHKVIKNCEFMIEKDDKLNLKTIYFIINPMVYYIDKNNIENFDEEVDRSSSITKLKAFMKILNSYLYEVKFKYKTFKDNSDIQEMYEIDYNYIDMINFCVTLVINIILILFLSKEDTALSITNILITVFSALQILFNLYFLRTYFKSKYKFNVLVARSEYEDKKMNFMDNLKVYALDSFIFHEDTYFMILIIIMNLLALISDSFKLLYSVELLYAVKLTKTIKLIVSAITSQMSNFISLFGFLIIFIYFYASISYSFLRNEFTIEIEGGTEENVCSTLLECILTYFNHGLRSGGGIGDILPEVSYGKGMYWFRFFNDFIFYIMVILIVLNILAGVIVSYFFEVREEENFKENDIKNNCFICNIDRATFERNKIKFEEHKKLEHNVKLYIRFLVGLKLVNEKDLDAEQSYIVNCIKKEEIKVFPVGASSSIGFKNVEESTEADEEEEEN